MILRQQAQARLQVIQCRFVGGRRLGFASRTQIEPRQHDSLRSLRDQAATEIPVVNDVKDLFFDPLGGRARPQSAVPPSDERLFLLGRNQRIGGLLHTVVQEGVHGHSGFMLRQSWHFHRDAHGFGSNLR